MSKLVIYTALFGDYDSLPEPQTGRLQGCDFICFTDQKIQSDIWKIVKVESYRFSKSMMNRYYKFHPHKELPGYDCSLYVDANIEIVNDPLGLFDLLLEGNASIFLPEHKDRECIYDEIQACFASRKASFRSLVKHHEFLKNDNFPKKFGLTENNLILRKHSSADAILWGECIWKGLNYYVERDQLVSPYCTWKYSIDIKELPENAFEKGDVFRFVKHKDYTSKSWMFKFIFKVNSIFLSKFFQIYLKFNLS